MSGLAVATAARAGAARVTVANRTTGQGRAAGGRVGVDGAVADFADLPAAIAAADLVISCTGAANLVITEPIVGDGARGRATRRARWSCSTWRCRATSTPPWPAARPGQVAVSVIGMDTLRGSGERAVGADEVAAVRAIVEEEFAAYGSAVRAARVTPTVVALRAKAATVVDAELPGSPGGCRRRGVSGRALEEMAQTVRRVVDKLLHAPTVRVKELASSPDGEEYAAALRVLFDLDPRTVDAVTHAEVDSPRHSQSWRGTCERGTAAARQPPEPDGDLAIGRRGQAAHRARPAAGSRSWASPPSAT